jgi:ABC-type microcin C transport system duplicated ATPase subunit YejF
MQVATIEERGACADELMRPSKDYTRSLLATAPRLVASQGV